MYKLILVDDEAEVRQGIIHKIDWAVYNFQVVGEAENGKEALDIIEKDIPDIVVTDIRMPIMDGLELSAILRERFPTVKIIILTGFDEFKYAQQAIKLDIVEYVLKPVTSKDIIEILSKIRTQIDSEIAQREDVKTLKEHYAKSLPVMRDKFLTSMITREMKKKEIDEKVAVYGLGLHGSSFAAAVISIDSNTIKGINFEGDVDLARFAVLNISEEIIAKHSFGAAFINNDYVVLIARFEAIEKESMLNKTFNILNEIRMNIEKYLKFTVTIGLGTICESLTLISDSFKNAATALDYKFVIGTNRAIYIEDLEQQYVEKVVFDDSKEQMLRTSIKVGTMEEMVETIDSLFKDIGDMKASFKDYQIYLLEIIATITKVSKGLQLDTGEMFGFNSNLFAELYKFDTIDEVKDWIKAICLKLMNYISSKRQDSCKLLVENAAEYVVKNYGDEDLSINKTSKYLHISPSYFSAIFKKETGETFLNFLVKVRLDAAKELLLSTNMKTSEIAEKVGYPDPHYFSYFFKKHYGLSPKEYKNSNKK